MSPDGGSRGSERVQALLDRMSVEEKVGQMTQLTLGAVAADSPRRGTVELDAGKLREAIVERHVGSILNTLDGPLTLSGWRNALEEIQALATAETRLGIPVLYGIDHVHGANYIAGGTIFPHNLGLAATFDEALVRRAAEVTAAETLAAGLPWDFAPVLDVGRQPLWPRYYETFGEAELVAGRLGSAAVRGLQEGPAGRVAATAKHYLGYSAPATGRDRAPALLGRRTIREHFLPPFRTAVEAGVSAVMVNSGEIDGEPVHASRYWLTDVLRGELGFRGPVVTDWADIAFLHTRHRVAPDRKAAARLAVEAGIDMAMTPDNFDFHDHLVALVAEGAVPETRLDASVRRVLTLKERLGLFDRPVPEPAREAPDVAGARAVALEASRASLVLLTNDGVLPLARDAKLAVTGPAAASRTALGGGWTYSWQGGSDADYPPDATTLVAELAGRAGAVEHVEGAGFTAEVDLDAAVAAAARADVAVVALGEDAYAEWAGDIKDLTLPAPQLRLARAVIATGTPTVLVLAQGRPRIIRGVADGAAAILHAGWPGVHGARAIAEVLFGDVNPSGRLPFTYPRHPNDLTLHDHKRTETFGPRLEPRGPGGYDPRFQLGDGLSYTTFEYEELRLGAEEVAAGDALAATVTVRNTGDRAGGHAVLLFTRRHYASVTPHVRRLRGFRKVVLEPGEAREVTFILDARSLEHVGRDGEPVLEAGAFDVMVGGVTATFRVA